MAIKASEVARRIGVKTGTLGKWRRQGKGPKGWYALSATVVVYPETEVQSFLREQRAASTGKTGRRAPPVTPEGPKQ
jgi:hypothetical protein